MHGTCDNDHPSGLLYLLQHESIPILPDAILELPPGREFNKIEFAVPAGVTRQIISTYIHHLLEVDILEEVPNTSPQRYRMAQSNIVAELFEVNYANLPRSGLLGPRLLRSGFLFLCRSLHPAWTQWLQTPQAASLHGRFGVSHAYRFDTRPQPAAHAFCRV